MNGVTERGLTTLNFSGDGGNIQPERSGSFLRYVFKAKEGHTSLSIPSSVSVVNAIRASEDGVKSVTLLKTRRTEMFTIYRLVKDPFDPDIAEDETIVLLALSAL